MVAEDDIQHHYSFCFAHGSFPLPATADVQSDPNETVVDADELEAAELELLVVEFDVLALDELDD